MTNTIEIVSKYSFIPGQFDASDNYLVMTDGETKQKLLVSRCCSIFEHNSYLELFAIHYLNYCSI